MTSLKQKYIATLVGCGVGDSLGMAVEGWNKDQIVKYVGKVTDFMDPVVPRNGSGAEITEDEFGKIGCYTRKYKKGEYTDDTILTLAIAESIAEKGRLDLDDICQKQIQAAETWGKGGFGRSTKTGFTNIKEGISPLESGVAPGMGNGPAMKMSPIGLYMHATGNYAEGLELARLIGRATHLDERALASGIVQAHAVYTLLNNSEKQDFLDSVVGVSRFHEKEQNYAALAERGDLTAKLEWVLANQNKSPEQALDALGNGCLAFESHPFTIFMFQKYWNDPMQGLIETVNLGGDCDTTGAIFGALAGAKNGMIFPEKWTNILQNKNRLAAAAEKIHALKQNEQ